VGGSKENSSEWNVRNRGGAMTEGTGKKDGGGKGADCGISVWVLQESNVSVYQELARVP